MIALVDYGAGNLTSVRKALAAIGAEAFVPREPDDLAPADGIIVPGVGHFGAKRALDARWMDAIVRHIGEGRPLLGICLGMQWLFEGSEEAPDVPGLGLFSGRCHRLSVREPLKVPHVGWNNLTLQREASIVSDVPDGAQVYFTHSYAAPVTGDTVAVTDHGGAFASVVRRGQIAGVQFHPEKSGEVGLTILRNWTALVG